MFSDNEKSLISADPITGDNIFLLGEEEHKNILKKYKYQFAEATEYVHTLKDQKKKYYRYFLRSPGKSKTEVSFVAGNGDVFQYNTFAGDLSSIDVTKECGIRPAIWFDTSKDNNAKTDNGKKKTESSPSKLPKEIVLGTYKDSPLVWIPIKASLNDGKVLCINKNAVDCLSMETKNPYEKTKVRNWLIKDFYNSFTSEEKNHLESHEIGDKVFLLSVSEIEKYGILKKDLVRELGLPYNANLSYWNYKTLNGDVAILENRGKHSINWYLRDFTPDPWGGKEYEYGYISRIGTYEKSSFTSGNSDVGIVPCIWYIL